MMRLSVAGSFLRTIPLFLTVLIANVSLGGTPGGVLDHTHAKVRSVISLQHLITPEVLKWPDVLGTAVGLHDDGEPDLVVYVDRDGLSKGDVVQAFPAEIGG